MTKITPKHTKAEILQAYSDLQAQASQGPSWEQVAAKIGSTAQTIARETIALARDCYNGGCLVRQWVSAVVAELSRPVLRSKA